MPVPNHITLSMSKELEEMGYKGEVIDRIEEYFMEHAGVRYRIIEKMPCISTMGWLVYSEHVSPHFRIYTSGELKALAPKPPLFYKLDQPMIQLNDGLNKFEIHKECISKFDKWFLSTCPVDVYFVKHGAKVTVEKC